MDYAELAHTSGVPDYRRMPTVGAWGLTSLPHWPVSFWRRRGAMS